MLVQADIATALHMRQPLVLRSSSERPNLHIAFKVKPTEDTAVAAGMIASLIVGQPTCISTSAQPVIPGPGDPVPSTVVYCVSKAQVSQFVCTLAHLPAFKGKVRTVPVDCTLNFSRDSPFLVAAICNVAGVQMRAA
jgi:superfamily II DNA helicase RecQ